MGPIRYVVRLEAWGGHEASRFHSVDGRFGCLAADRGRMPALAQTPNRVYRLGHLGNAAPSEASARQITLPELARLGYVEGRNLVFDARIGESDALPGLMRELLAATGRRHRRWRRGDHGCRHRDAHGADRDLRRRPD